MRYPSSAHERPVRASGAPFGLVAAVPATLVAALLAASAASAQDAPRVEPPPAPQDLPATLSVEVHGTFEAPIERSAICPPAEGCVLGLGVGVGAQIERRTADRVGLFAAYDFWLLDANGVFELGALHAARGGIRYVIDDSWLVHPFIDAAIGFVVFGDTGNVATVGGVITAGGGAELELSEAVAFVAAAEAWVFATTPFETRDAITRADPFGVNVALQITLGIAVVVGPSSALR